MKVSKSRHWFCLSRGFWLLFQGNKTTRCDNLCSRGKEEEEERKLLKKSLLLISFT